MNNYRGMPNKRGVEVTNSQLILFADSAFSIIRFLEFFSLPNLLKKWNIINLKTLVKMHDFQNIKLGCRLIKKGMFDLIK